MRPVLITFLAGLTLGMGTVEAQEAAAQPLAEFSGLTGSTWQAEGTGFSTTLSYRWLFEGRLVEGTNEVRSTTGRVIARYHGLYLWNPRTSEIEFVTVAEGGEVHRGRAWWSEGILWHEAEVAGGSIDGYRSAVRLREGRLEYFAVYGEGREDAQLLATTPLRYSRAPD